MSYLHMKTQLLCLRVWPILLALYGCMEGPRPLAIVDDVGFTEERVYEVIDAFEAVTGQKLELDFWTIRLVHETSIECGDITAIGCTSWNNYSVTIANLPEYSHLLLAHEFCHVYLNGDHDHKRLDYFDRTNPNSVVSRVEAMLADPAAAPQR